MNWTKEQRKQIEEIADNNGIDLDIAYAIADMLGPDELYDGFVTELQDMGGF